MVLPAIPFLGYILALALGALAVAFSAGLLSWLQTPLLKIVLLGFGAYMAYLALPQFFGKREQDRRIALFMFILGVALMATGATNILLKSIAGG